MPFDLYAVVFDGNFVVGESLVGISIALDTTDESTLSSVILFVPFANSMYSFSNV